MPPASLVAVFLLLLGGCSAFQGNLFQGLARRQAPDAADYQGPGGMDRLASDLSSPGIVAALKNDPDAAGSIAVYLQTFLSTPPLTEPEQREAAALYGDLCLLSSSGDELVNNAVTLALGGVGGASTANAILQGLVPPAILRDATAFAAMMEGLLAAEEAYALYGASIPPAPPAINAGDTAQKAAIAWTMRVVMNALEGSLALSDSPPDRSVVEMQLFELLNDRPSGIAGVIIPNPFASSPAWLSSIFTAAGVTLPS